MQCLYDILVDIRGGSLKVENDFFDHLRSSFVEFVVRTELRERVVVECLGVGFIDVHNFGQRKIKNVLFGFEAEAVLVGRRSEVVA